MIMIAEPKPKFIKIWVSQPIKIRCLTVLPGEEDAYIDFVLQPGEHTLALKTDENGSILGHGSRHMTIEARPPFGIAHYRCRKCKIEWTQPPEPTACIGCGHLYVDWLNYE